LTDSVRLVSGFEQLDAAVDDTGAPPRPLNVTVRAAHQSSPIALSARVFPAYDGSSGRLVLLTNGVTTET
jgi:hypothetical protein